MSATTDTEQDACAARPQRADARRNRGKILAAARTEFGARGIDAQMDDIARRAGVGVGTVYRHFPTKQDLVAAIATAHFEALAAEAEAVLARGGDPWTAWEGFARWAADEMGRDAALGEIMANHPEAMDAAGAEKAGLMAHMGEMMGRAVAAGQMRPDAAPQDMAVIMCGLGTVLATAGAVPEITGPRYLELMIDGMRARS